MENKHKHKKNKDFVATISANIKPISQYTEYPKEVVRISVDISNIQDCGIMVILKEKQKTQCAIFEADVFNTIIERIL